MPFADLPPVDDWIATCSRCGHEDQVQGLTTLQAEVKWWGAGWRLGLPGLGAESTDLCPSCASIPSPLPRPLRVAH